MKDCSFKIQASYESGGHDEKDFRKREWSMYGAVEDLMGYIRRLAKDPQTKSLKALSITLSAK